MKLALLAAISIVFACGARAQTLAEVVTHASEAAGVDALARHASSHAKLRVTLQGLSGVGERIEDLRGGRVVERFDLGVIRLAEGFDGETPWSIEGNNPARPEREVGAVAGAISAAYRRTLSYLTSRHPGRVELRGERSEGERRFAVLAIVPEHGRPFDLWLDARTWLPDRTIERDASDTITTTYSDWRHVDGVAVPFSVRESNGDAKYDTSIAIESISFGPARTPAEFAMPAPPSRDFGIAGGAPRATIPFELANNHIFAPVKLGAREVTLLVDTGGLNVVTPELARELGLETSGALEGRGVGDAKVDVAVTQIARVELGGAFLENQTFFVIPLGALSAVEGRPARGIVGYEVFRRFATHIDYARRELTLHDPAGFSYQGTGTAAPFVFDEHTPRIEAEVDGLRGWFDIDTGARSSLVLARPFVAKHALRPKYAPRFAAVTGWGVGGPTRADLTRASVLKIGPYAVREPVTHLSLQEAGSFAAEGFAGNIGGGVLRRFNLLLDYEHQRIWFEPNANFGEREIYDRSGLWLNDASHALEVIDVTPGGPGERAGVRTGDKIRAVDGVEIAPGDLLRLRARFRSEAPGARMRLELEAADGARREATLTLAEIV
jgi:hypothetical protein